MAWTELQLENTASMCPPAKSATMGVPPLYAAWMKRTPACFSRRSAARWFGVPTPGLPNRSSEALARRMKSENESIPLPVGTIKANGDISQRRNRDQLLQYIEVLDAEFRDEGIRGDLGGRDHKVVGAIGWLACDVLGPHVSVRAWTVLDDQGCCAKRGLQSFQRDSGSGIRNAPSGIRHHHTNLLARKSELRVIGYRRPRHYSGTRRDQKMSPLHVCLQMVRPGYPRAQRVLHTQSRQTKDGLLIEISCRPFTCSKVFSACAGRDMRATAFRALPRSPADAHRAWGVLSAQLPTPPHT